jgi:formamidopyrimidine-DNA glycosylase
MPELPEVEASRALLESVLVGKRIVKVDAAVDEKVFVDVTAPAFNAALLGSTVQGVHRRGKHLWWQLQDRPTVSPYYHFGMTGSFAVRGLGSTKYKSFVVDTSQWPPKFTKLTVELADGTAIAFTDPRRFARIRLLSGEPLLSEPLKQLGPDFLLSPPSLEDWTRTLSKRSAPIKALLLDQSVACGVGNWVADEALFQARIHPESPANALPPDAVAALLDCCVRICRQAADVQADSDRFPPHWLFHVRWGKKAGKTSEGHAIAFETVGGRTSCYVPALQKRVSAAAPRKAAREEGAAGEGAASAPKRAKKKPAVESAAVVAAVRKASTRGARVL